MNPLRRFFGHLLGAVGVVGIALFFLVFSCSQRLPTSPQAPMVAFNPGQLNLAVVADPGKTVSVTVGFEGDTISFPVGKDTAYFIIPQGALKKEDPPVTFSFRAEIGQTVDSQLFISFYDFGPAGLVFTNDCYLVHPAQFPEGTDLPFYWFDPLSGSWLLEHVAPVKDGKATFVVTHFSKYSAPKGPGLGSGGQQ